VLLLDEPTSVLSPPEAEALLDLIRRMRDRGVAVVLITHKLAEALEYGDSVTVLRRGAVAFDGPANQVTRDALIHHMLGEAPPVPSPPPRGGLGVVRATATDLSVHRLGGSGTGLRHATLEVRAGELVGVAAVEGNGHQELLRCFAGLVPLSGGSLQTSGVVSFIPEDRTTEGLIGELSLTQNVALIRGKPAPWLAGPWIDWARAGQHTAQLLVRHAISAPGPDAAAASLSGGNQQRLLIAGALARDPAILIAENPTRGLDVQGAASVLQRLLEAAGAGVAVLVYQPDLDELLSIATRIVVLAAGKLQEARAGAGRAEIGRMMLGEPVAV
jgi:simple sugar transport system ATP-binding protein